MRRSYVTGALVQEIPADEFKKTYKNPPPPQNQAAWV